MKTFHEWLNESNFYRYIHRNGLGLMNNQGLDRSRLTDDEEFELIELLDFGLEQPRNVPSGAIFAFSQDGVARHRRLLELLKKASMSGVRVQKLPASDYDVVWTSTDGQVALLDKKVKNVGSE